MPNAQLVVVRNLSQEAVASTVRLHLPDGAGADLERSAADTLRSLAGTERLTDVVFVGDLAARRTYDGKVDVAMRTAARSTTGPGPCSSSAPSRRCGPNRRCGPGRHAGGG